MSDAQGLVYDPAVRDYEQGRTRWPAAVADGVAGSTVLDLGAGTGKLTRALVPCYDEVIAVEPLQAMRALGETVVPSAEWREGTAEAIPLRDQSVDAAFVADAFHWFNSAAAATELARVLRPGGTLVVMFAVWDGTWHPPLPAAAGEAVEVVSRRTGEAGAAKFKRGDWRAGFAGAPFSPFVEREVTFSHKAVRANVIAYYLSMSTIAARPDHERRDLAAELTKILPDAEYRLNLRAETHRTTRLADAF